MKKLLILTILLLVACTQTTPELDTAVTKGDCLTRPTSCPTQDAPVCGWFDESIKCIAYPCAATFDNECLACADENVASWTRGECPKPGEAPKVEEPEVKTQELQVNFRAAEQLYDYGSNADEEYVRLAQTDCKEKGGVFNACGSACAPGEFCIAACVLTCKVEKKTTAAKATTHSVKIESMQFTPKILRIRKGDKVEWTNLDGVAHTVTADGGHFDSPLLGKGQSWSVTFRESGSFQYHCTPHRTMKGEIFVE